MNMMDILCLGEPMVEFNQQPDGRFLMGFGGDVSNTAVAAARHGARAGVITNVGDDQFGAALRDMWRREGVDDTCVSDAPGGETGVYFVTHHADGHRFTYRRKNSAASRMAPASLPHEALRSAAVFYSSGISLAVSVAMRESVIEAARITRGAGVLFAFDPNLRTALWPLEEARSVIHDIMRGCDIALPGFDDARRLTGLSSPEDIARFYHSAGAGVVALTLGKDGAFISADGEQRRLAPHAVKAVDTAGAGDCFNGAFLAETVRTGDPFRAGELANMAAALSSTGFGATAPVPTLAETERGLQNARNLGV